MDFLLFYYSMLMLHKLNHKAVSVYSAVLLRCTHTHSLHISMVYSRLTAGTYGRGKRYPIRTVQVQVHVHALIFPQKINCRQSVE